MTNQPVDSINHFNGQIMSLNTASYLALNFEISSDIILMTKLSFDLA